MATQADINNIVNEIVNSYTGKTEAFEGGYVGQCTVPVSYYVLALTGAQPPYMANDRADGWGVAFPSELAQYFSHQPYQPGVSYPKGTLLIWNSPHIAIVLSSDGSNTVEVFEQNADPDGSPCGTKSRIINNQFHTCTYALVPIIEIPTPVSVPVAVTPTPVTPSLSAPSAAPMSVPKAVVEYSISATIPGYSNATDAGSAVNSNSNVPPGTYYIWSTYNNKPWLKNVTRDSTLKEPGWWINCHDNPGDTTYYIPPQPTPTPTPVPVVPAQVATIPMLTIEPTPVASNGNSQNPPGVNNWRETYKPFTVNRKPLQYTVNAGVVVHDYAGVRPDIHVTKGQSLAVFGTFTFDGVLYGRLKAKYDTDFAYYFGIPMRLLTYKGSLLDTVLDTFHITKTRLEDDTMQFLDILPKWYKKRK